MRLALAFIALAAAWDASPQGVQFNHPALKARGIPVPEYQAIGRSHDADCQSQALQAALQRYPSAVSVVASEQDAKRDQARAEMVSAAYIRCMEARGWVRVVR